MDSLPMNVDNVKSTGVSEQDDLTSALNEVRI